MKKIIAFVTLTLATIAQAQVSPQPTTLLVCEGKLGEQDITVLDDNRYIGIFKGKVDIAAGPRGNQTPYEKFGGGEISFIENNENCTLTARSAKGSFVLEALCSGEGPAVLKELNLPTLTLTAPAVTMACRLEDF